MQLSKAAKAGLCLTLAFTPGLSAAEVLAAEPEETEEESLSPQPSGTPEATPVSDPLLNEETIPEQKDDPASAQNEPVKQEASANPASETEPNPNGGQLPDNQSKNEALTNPDASSADPSDPGELGLIVPADDPAGKTEAEDKPADTAQKQSDTDDQTGQKSGDAADQNDSSKSSASHPENQTDLAKTANTDTDSTADNSDSSVPADDQNDPDPDDGDPDDPGSDDNDPDDPGTQNFTPEEIKAKNEEIARINAARKLKYEQELEQYQKDCEQYQNVHQIKTNEDQTLILIGNLGEKGVSYYDDVSLLVTKDCPELENIVWTQGIQWNDDTEILGDENLIQINTPKGDMGNVTMSGAPYINLPDKNPYQEAGNTCYYDLTKVCQNPNSSPVTFTNVTTDSNGRKIDMVIKFSPFTMLPGAASIGTDAQNLLMMFKAPDKSFEFNMNAKTVMQLNLSDISFVYHDDKDQNKLNAGLVMIASDIDGAQSFTTDMGNQLVYLDGGSNITQKGDCFEMINPGAANCTGMSSAPAGTAILAGIGKNFFYTYNQETIENAKKHASSVIGDDWDWSGNYYGRGFWLNLFGNTTTMDIHTKPIPPEYIELLPLPDQPEPDEPESTPPTPDKPTPHIPTPHQPTPDKPDPHQPTPDKPKPNQPEPVKPSTHEPGKSTPAVKHSDQPATGTLAAASPVYYLNEQPEQSAPAKAAALAPVTKAVHPNTALGTHTFMDLALAGLSALAGGLSLSHLFKKKDKE